MLAHLKTKQKQQLGSIRGKKELVASIKNRYDIFLLLKKKSNQTERNRSMTWPHFMFKNRSILLFFQSTTRLVLKSTSTTWRPSTRLWKGFRSLLWPWGSSPTGYINLCVSLSLSSSSSLFPSSCLMSGIALICGRQSNVFFCSPFDISLSAIKVNPRTDSIFFFLPPTSCLLWYDMVSANGASSEPQCYKISDRSHDARRGSPDLPNEPSDQYDIWCGRSAASILSAHEII